MNVKISLGLLILALALMACGPASAAILTIDTDSGTAGIQSGRTVNVGDMFNIGVIFVGDGTASLDGFFIALSFNNSGVVVNATPNNFFAGAVTAAVAVDTAFDLLDSTNAVAPQDSLTASNLPPVGGFASSVAGGILVLPPAPFTGGPVGANVEVELVSLNLTAVNAGSSRFAFEDQFTEILFEGDRVQVNLGLNATEIIVRGNASNVLPEPSALITWGLALVSVIAIRRRMLDCRSGCATAWWVTRMLEMTCQRFCRPSFRATAWRRPV